MTNRIALQNVDLHYASVAFRERSLKTMLGSLLNPKRERSAVVDIHALKQVTININAGERVGLLGHNGAGKSTFLKMVAGLYPISSGSRTVEGVVRSLFDLSLGFEPDATGRENILYRGLLLGLSPTFMRSIEQEIVDFADLGEFIDYPIKTYSAGMQVRLAFAVSTAVGGDILLLDEVVGAVAAVQKQHSEKSLSLVGYSLGGNFALRVALRAPQHDLHIRQVVAVCPVLDPARTLRALEVGPYVYRRYFVHKWRNSLLQKCAAWPLLYDRADFLKDASLTEMTEALVLQHAGFTDLESYLNGYALVDDVLQPLRVRSRIIAALDDPIIPSNDLERLAQPQALTITPVARGGHCGFLNDLAGPSWADEYIRRQLHAAHA